MDTDEMRGKPVSAMTAPTPQNRNRQTPRDKVEKAGPSNGKLKHLARSSPPSQAWFDAMDNPFEKPNALSQRKDTGNSKS
jgi:hypothetical protein